MECLTSRYTNFKKWLKGRKRMKGQWYIVAAILFSYSLLTFFDSFNGYSQLDYSSIASQDEDATFYNVLQGLKNISNGSNELNANADAADYAGLVQGSLLGKGTYFKCNYSISSGVLDIKELEVSDKSMRVRIVNN
jgi:hypothetical protein